MVAQQLEPAIRATDQIRRVERHAGIAERPGGVQAAQEMRVAKYQSGRQQALAQQGLRAV